MLTQGSQLGLFQVVCCRCSSDSSIALKFLTSFQTRNPQLRRSSFQRQVGTVRVSFRLCDAH